MDGDQPREQLTSMPDESSPNNNKAKLRVSLDYRFIIVILLLIIAGMLIIWRPWVRSHVSDRTIDITGEATLQATPDEYVFTPSYDFTNVDKQTALNQLTEQSNTIVSKLKSLGATDNQIKTDTSGSEPYYTFVTNSDNSSTYTLQLTVTVDSASLAQKIQDYLATTSPSGAVSPDVNFSDAQQKSLDSQAREAATKDAKSKAEQTANNLGFKLGAVKSVTDGSGFGEPLPFAAGTNIATNTSGSAQQPALTLQPGQNKLDYSVDVVYYIY